MIVQAAFRLALSLTADEHSPSGASLGHANQNSDTVVQFKVDQSTGTLTPTGQPIQVPKPVCVLFVKV
jgi:6-phosphogluconolactonase